MKENIQKMKEDIKVMASEQKECKRNRKTIHIKGNRTMPAWEAAYAVLQNKHDLGLFYVAYARLRGRDPAECYPTYKEHYSEPQIDMIVERYPFAAVTSIFLYVLIREDLRNAAYKAVQAGHAVAQFLLDHPNNEWGNNYLIYVRVKDEDQLRFWEMKLNDRGQKTSCFFEPDLDNQMTALACHPSDEGMFNKLQLLR